MTSPAQPAHDVPKVIWSWAMFDWANSAFTTLVITFIYSTYFTKAMAPDENTGTTWWTYAVSTSAILTALLSPLCGAAADRGGARKKFLMISSGISVLATLALAFVSPDMAYAPLIALLLFVVADMSFEIGNVFYNAFLPSIASPDRIGRVSGYGWGLGYVGGMACMIVALVGFVQPDVPWFGMSKELGWNIRATNLLVAGWFLVFALPLFFVVPETRLTPAKLSIKETFAELGETVRNMRKYSEIVKFLIARVIFNDGLVTIFAFGGIYAAGTFGMTMSEIIVFGIVLNVSSGLGAFAFGFLDDKIGGKKTIMVTIVALGLTTALAVWAPDRTWFWVAGVLLGIFVGPNQSASRSLMGRFVPDRHQSEFFGFFAFSGKATAFLGPFLLGQVTKAFDSQRAGIASILVFFLVGALLLMMVDERKGVAAAQAANQS
ncbi:MAG: MFS transporter [Acidobacteria bacterium]|nr:MFS transporter [Acidobacteriota bacterium]